MNSAYQAISTKLSNVRPHPGADRLQLADAAGYQVIVSLDAREGDAGMVIPSGCALSPEFCLAHELYRKHPTTGETMGGYLDGNGRVVALSLRGANSEALFMSWDDVIGLERADGPPQAGESFDSLALYPAFVAKYESKAQRQRKEQGAQSPQQARSERKALARHYETAQLRHSAAALSDAMVQGGTLIATEKIHGTSGRTGRVLVEQKQNVLIRAWNRIAPKFLRVAPRQAFEAVTGTRNTIVHKGHVDRYRLVIHRYFADQLRDGEIVYYEIAGFTHTGAPIMPNHSMSKAASSLPSKQAKKLAKQFGDDVVYSYGCHPQGVIIGEPDSYSGHEEPRFRVFVYRITQDGRELTWREIEKRMDPHALGASLGHPGVFETAPWMDAIKDPEMSPSQILEYANEMSRMFGAQGSAVTLEHPGEGICLRVDTDDEGGKAVKHKGFLFCVLEGIAANDPDFVDPEDVA